MLRTCSRDRWMTKLICRLIETLRGRPASVRSDHIRVRVHKCHLISAEQRTDDEAIDKSTSMITTDDGDWSSITATRTRLVRPSRRFWWLWWFLVLICPTDLIATIHSFIFLAWHTHDRPSPHMTQSSHAQITIVLSLSLRFALGPMTKFNYYR